MLDVCPPNATTSKTGHAGVRSASSVNSLAIAEPSYVAIVNTLRLAGWRVGAHNDFWMERQQEWRTFWMWTHPKTGRYIESEGANDLEALSRCLMNMTRLAD